MSGSAKDTIINFCKINNVPIDVHEQVLSIYDNTIVIECGSDGNKCTPYFTDDIYKLYTIYKCHPGLLDVRSEPLSFDYLIVELETLETLKTNFNKTDCLTLYNEFINFIAAILKVETGELKDKLNTAQDQLNTAQGELKAAKAAQYESERLKDELKAAKDKFKAAKGESEVAKAELKATKTKFKDAKTKFKDANSKFKIATTSKNLKKLDLVKKLNMLKNNILDNAYNAYKAEISKYINAYKAWLKDKLQDKLQQSKPAELKNLSFINVCRSMFLEMDPIKCADDLRELYNYFTPFNEQELYVLPRSNFYNGEFEISPQLLPKPTLLDSIPNEKKAIYKPESESRADESDVILGVEEEAF
jgi:hypothetical protein